MAGSRIMTKFQAWCFWNARKIATWPLHLGKTFPKQPNNGTSFLVKNEATQPHNPLVLRLDKIMPDPETLKHFSSMVSKGGFVKCFGCNHLLMVDDAFRCFFCKHYYCSSCGEEHFRMDREDEL